jgi:CO/xanthine dehydrogenase Mo-binding subunit
MKMRLKMGFAEDGTILAEDMTVFCNAGAYASGTSSIVWAMCGKLFKVHCCKNIRFTGYPVITNTPLGGPMRGFGSPQTFFAQQRLMDRAAKALGIDLLNLQYKNLTQPHGLDYRFDQPHGNARPIDCLKRAVKLIDYDACLCEQNESANERFRIGIGVSVGAHGNGMFGIRTDITAMILKMNDDGSCVLFSGSHEMGNSSITLQKQIASEVLGLPMEMLAAVSADTELTPYQLGDYSSRGAFVSGRAALLVAEDMRKKLSELAAEMLETEAADFTFSGGRVTAPDGKSVSIGEIVQFARHHKFTELISEKTAASPASVVSYGAHIVKVRVDTFTGKVELLDYAAVHDVGRAINPLSVRGQIEGAVQMGAGYALTEDIRLDENGRVKNTTFRTYHMLHANEMPKRLMIDLIEEIEPAGPFGAKSIGECSVVPVAAAVANAISNAVGREFNDLPITPERILTALKKT